ncbi:amidohydrolase family protein [Temperatibacter marinus]|uniref:Amidohydrolase family protein n=1 Tax=Temperatibacter marinus TaxID=1456591 RepID=A0AA52EJT8_9PROT|nr:amidohydrolase family protein [Temperatibacter marinus]WND03569.1 amidohydrolase family protein [Temperatibacter marinus]
MHKMITSFLMILTLSLSSMADEGKKEQKKEEKKKHYTILHTKTLLAVPGEDPVQDQSIIIHKGKIVDVVSGAVTTVNEDKATVKIINLGDNFVMPGLIDVHVHISGRKGDKVAKALDAAANAKKTIAAGFTTIREIGLRDWSTLKVFEKIKKGHLDGPRIIYAGKIIGVGPNGCNGVESCRKMTRENIQKGAKWIKIYSSCSGFYTCSEEDYPTVFFDDEIKAIVETAKKYRIPVAAHSHPTASAHYVLDRGVKSIEHGTFLDEKAMRRMKKEKVFYVPTVAVQDFLEKSKKKKTFDKEKQTHIDKMMGEAINSRIEKAHAMGVLIATGSDAGVVPNGKNYREIERLSEIDGISNAEALQMATVNGAALLGKSKSLGTIEKDKLADIIVIDGNPLNTIKDIRNVKFVMINGKVLINNL